MQPKLRTPRSQIIVTGDLPEHDDDETGLNENPKDFLDRAHPENDSYMQAIEHVQRQIMHQSSLLRPKQVQMLKMVFAGKSYTEVAKAVGSSQQTVSKIARGELGGRLLNLLQYHMGLIEGPNQAQRRNMMWRIAAANEFVDPKTSMKALDSLEKSHFQQQQVDNPQADGKLVQQAVTINIDQRTMPKGNLD
jgi:hypothetical protein